MNKQLEIEVGMILEKYPTIQSKNTDLNSKEGVLAKKVNTYIHLIENTVLADTRTLPDLLSDLLDDTLQTMADFQLNVLGMSKHDVDISLINARKAQRIDLLKEKLHSSRQIRRENGIEETRTLIRTYKESFGQNYLEKIGVETPITESLEPILSARRTIGLIDPNHSKTESKPLFKGAIAKFQTVNTLRRGTKSHK